MVSSLLQRQLLQPAPHCPHRAASCRAGTHNTLPVKGMDADKPQLASETAHVLCQGACAAPTARLGSWPGCPPARALCADSGWEAGFHLATAVDNAFILGYAFLVRGLRSAPCLCPIQELTAAPLAGHGLPGVACRHRADRGDRRRCAVLQRQAGPAGAPHLLRRPPPAVLERRRLTWAAGVQCIIDGKRYVRFRDISYKVYGWGPCRCCLSVPAAGSPLKPRAACLAAGPGRTGSPPSGAPCLLGGPGSPSCCLSGHARVGCHCAEAHSRPAGSGSTSSVATSARLRLAPSPALP